jgi:hypothetical protein
MLARTGWGRDTTENASMRGIGKAIAAGAIMIITATEIVAAIMIAMTAINLRGAVPYSVRMRERASQKMSRERAPILRITSACQLGAGFIYGLHTINSVGKMYDTEQTRCH